MEEEEGEGEREILLSLLSLNFISFDYLFSFFKNIY